MRDRPARHVPARRRSQRRFLTDGGTPEEGDAGSDGNDPQTGDAADESIDRARDGPDEESEDDQAGSDRSNVEVMEEGEAEPADPEWEPPDVDDIPEFEVRADQPVVEPSGDPGGGGGRDAATGGDDAAPLGGAPPGTAGPGGTDDPTAGMPNDAQAPGATAVSSEGTEAYVAALELCARLPDDVALPQEAADLVPAAVEAELEQDIGNFAAAEFDNPRPHVDTLDFEECGGEVWLRIRIGLPSGDFDNLDPERLRTYALQELEGVL